MTDFHNFILDAEVSSSHHLIKMKFLKMSSIVKNCLSIVFEQFLGRAKPKQSEAEQSPVIFDLYNPSRITSEGMSLADDGA